MLCELFENIKWKYFKYQDVFSIKKGKRLTLQEQEKGNTPYISSSSLNNGVDNYINNGYTDKNCLSFACYGSIGCVFYHPNKVWISDNCNAIYLKKKELNENLAMFLIPILELEKYRFSYGITAKLERLKKFKIKLPVRNNSIDWSFIEKYIKKIKKNIRFPESSNILNKKIELNHRLWKFFLLNEIFILKRGKRLIKECRERGTVPFVTAGQTNLGVKQYIDSLNLEQEVFKNRITVDMFCNSYYQLKKFSCDDNVLTLKSKYDINKYVILFIVTIIKQDKYRYQYGRQYRQKNFNQHKIKLPAKQNEKGECEPDWKFMEDYIKSLPYSSNI